MIKWQSDGANTVRYVLALGLLISLCAPVEAARVQHPKAPKRRLYLAQPVTVPKGFAVPGWTDEETRYWLDQATGPKD
jgi:hypothetical protein